MISNNYIHSLRVSNDDRLLGYDDCSKSIVELLTNVAIKYLNDGFANITKLGSSTIFESNMFQRFDPFIRIFDKWYVIHCDGLADFEFELYNVGVCLNIKSNIFSLGSFNCKLIIDFISKSVEYRPDPDDCPILYKDLLDLDISDKKIIELICRANDYVNHEIEKYMGSLRYSKLTMLGVG